MGGANIFRVVGRDDRQGIVADNYVADACGDRKVAILHGTPTYGKGFADEARRQLSKSALKEVMYLDCAPGESDSSRLVPGIGSASLGEL